MYNHRAPRKKPRGAGLFHIRCIIVQSVRREGAAGTSLFEQLSGNYVFYRFGEYSARLLKLGIRRIRRRKPQVRVMRVDAVGVCRTGGGQRHARTLCLIINRLCASVRNVQADEISALRLYVVYESGFLSGSRMLSTSSNFGRITSA